MKTPATSKLFTRVVDKESGVPYYVLTTKVCEYQQGFYFVNDSMTKDGRYLWFMATINPIYNGVGRVYGYVDFELDEVFLCGDSIGHAPYVDVDTGELYFTQGSSIFLRKPGKDEMAKLLCKAKIPGYVKSIATHLTRTSDKKHFFLDAHANANTNIQGVVDIETGEFEQWATAPHNTNHGQINPKNDRLALCAYDSTVDAFTGEKVLIPRDENGVYQRLWTVTAEGERTCYPPINNYATHEWWSADGTKIYYCSDNYGLCSYDITNGEHICFLRCDPWHGYSTRDDRYVIFDVKRLERYGGKWYRGCPASVQLLDRKTDKLLTVVTEMPENGHTPENPNNYHIDPHPRFVADEKYVVFTTTELGGCDLALADMSELLSCMDKL